MDDACHAGPGRRIWGHWWRELARDCTFIRYDQRGCGLSDREAPSYSLDARVQDLEAVADSLDVETFDLFGFSHGAMPAIENAYRHPDRLSRLIIYGGFARGVMRPAKSKEEALAESTLIQLRWDRNERFRTMFAAGMMPDATPEQLAEADDLMGASMHGQSPLNLAVTTPEAFNVFDRLPHIKTPSIVFHSLGSLTVDAEEGRVIASHLPNARFVAIPSRNHILVADEPGWEIFVSELRAFLGAESTKALTAHTVIGRDGLSGREVEVLSLVAAGRSDQEVANTLGISPRTVSNHVRNILEKTGSANRVQAAVWAAHRGLA